MKDSTLYLRCKSCMAINRFPAEKLLDQPRCGKCKAPLEFPRVPLEVTSQNFDREVLRWPGIVLVEFWSPRCGICTAIRPFLETLVRRKPGLLRVALINVEKEWPLAHRFDIRSSPVFFVYRDGMKINELYGALPRPQLEAWIESAIRG